MSKYLTVLLTAGMGMKVNPRSLMKNAELRIDRGNTEKEPGGHFKT